MNTYNTVTYNADDTVATVTDPRGVVATYSHNDRHLVTQISYSVSSGLQSTVPARPTWDPYNAVGPPLYPDIVQTHEQLYVNGGDPFNYSGGYTLDGLPVSEAQLAHMMDTGAGVAGLFFHGKMIGFWDFTGHGNVGTSGGNFWLPLTERVWVRGGEPVDIYSNEEEGPDTVKFYTEEIGHWEVRVTGYLSFGGGLAQNQRPQNPRPFSSSEIDSLLSDLNGALAIKDCLEFTKRLLEQLKSETGRSQHGTTDIRQLFQAVRDGRGFDYRSNLGAEARAGGGPGTAGMSITTAESWRRNKTADDRGRTVIHELFHVAGYDHDVIARVMFKMGERWDNAWKPWIGSFPDPESDEFFFTKDAADRLEGAYSAFMKNILDQHCK